MTSLHFDIDHAVTLYEASGDADQQEWDGNFYGDD